VIPLPITATTEMFKLDVGGEEPPVLLELLGNLSL